ncbi:hypothetical protein D3C73_1466720 [compost metagenome]
MAPEHPVHGEAGRGSGPEWDEARLQCQLAHHLCHPGPGQGQGRDGGEAGPPARNDAGEAGDPVIQERIHGETAARRTQNYDGACREHS